MSTFTKRIASSTDDAEQLVISPYSMDLTSSDLELDNDGTDGYVGMRWTNVTIPQGATIDSAKIQFAVKELEVDEPLEVTFRGEDIDDAPTFTSTAANISDRTETSASVDWDIPWWDTLDEEGADQLSAELKTIVQEIIDRPGWESGNSLVIMIKAWPDNTQQRIAWSYNGSPTQAAELQITYTETVAYEIVAALGTFALTGIAINFRHFFISITSQSFALTGIATNLLKDSLLSLVTGSINLTGKAVTLLKQSKISIVSQSFSLTGFTSNFYYGVGTLIAAVSSFLLTGKDILLSIIKNDPGYNPLICFKREPHKMERHEPIERKDPGFPRRNRQCDD